MGIRIVVGGCRYYNDYSLFCKFVDTCLLKIKDSYDIIILSGHCSGVDAMAERYADENNYDLEIYPADWEKHGKAAGPLRNKKMVEKSDCVVAFWDGKSRGTKSLIDYAKRSEKPLRICKIPVNTKQ